MRRSGSLKRSVKLGEKVVEFGTKIPCADPIKHKEASMWKRFWDWANGARGWTAVWIFLLIFVPLLGGLFGVAMWLRAILIELAARQ